MPKRVLLTPEEAGEALGVGRTMIYALLRAGDLESVQIGRLRRISLSAVEAYAEQLATRCSSTHVA
jgi:excisionase family DNA binding protein